MPGGPPEHTAKQGPARRPSCVCSDALIWAKMSRASFQPAERGQTLLTSREVWGKPGWTGSGRQRDGVRVHVCVWQQWVVTLCDYQSVLSLLCNRLYLASLVTASSSQSPATTPIHPSLAHLLVYTTPTLLLIRDNIAIAITNLILAVELT